MNYYNDYHIHSPLDKSNQTYLSTIDLLIKQSLMLSPRVTVFRFDLRYPVDTVTPTQRAITRFFESLKAQLIAKTKRARKEGKRVHPYNFLYIWVRERDTSEEDHFHCAIFLNKDAFSVLGDYAKWEGNMAARIKRAWSSALKLPIESSEGLVHFPKNGTYHLNLFAYDYFKKRASLFYRLSYFAKNTTKQYKDGMRNIGCSRLSDL